MADLRFLAEASNRFRFNLTNSSTGKGLTGLTSSSTGLIISTMVDNEATATAYTSAGSTIETITTLGTFAAPTATKCRFKEVDATNHPGLYEFQFADARFSVSSSRRVVITVPAVTGLSLADCNYEVQLLAVNLYTAKVPATIAAGDIATDAITAASVKADAVTKIQAGLSTYAGGAVASVTGAVGSVTGLTASDVGAIKVKTDNLPASPASTTNITAGTITTVTNLTNAATAGDFTATMKAATLARVTLVDTTTTNTDMRGTDSAALAATALSDAVWTGAKAAFLDAAITSRMATFTYTAPDNSTITAIAGYLDTEVTAIKAKTDLIPAAPAAVGDIPTADQVATATLKLDWTGITGEADRSLLNAGRFIRNGFSISGSTLTVLKEDDATAAYTRSLTTNAAADPITGVA